MNGKSIILKALVLGALVSLGACASTSHVMNGTARPPTTPDQVKVYWQPPARYEKIALIDATAHSAFGPGGQKTVDKVIERLKVEAAKIGANGVIVGNFSDAQTSSIGTGVGGDSYSRNSSVGVGVGGSIGVFKKTGWAQAIFVTDAADPAADMVPAPMPAPPDATGAPAPISPPAPVPTPR